MDTDADRSKRDRALFDAIAHGYSKKDCFRPSMIARQTRLLQTIASVTNVTNPDILELGCGAGYAARYLQGQYRTYTGIDYSKNLIDVALAQNGLPGAEFHVADLYDWKPRKTYDLVFAIGVLHHLPDMSRAMQIFRSALKSDGYIVANEPQPANVLFHGLRQIRARIDPSYSADQVELGENALVELFKSAGLRNVTALPQGLLSTPFAEVILKPEFITLPLSTLACKTDRYLESSIPNGLKKVSWNLVIKGQNSG